MESWILRVSSKTLQETRNIHDFMNLPKFELIAYIYIVLQITNI